MPACIAGRWSACRSRSRTCSTSRACRRAPARRSISTARSPTRDGSLVRKLEAAGAILVGGLNMGEYAYDFTGENAHYGPSRNPRDPTRMTGGSSGGSGAAVAAGEVPLALGSDTNGSIRVPSSLCGLFGLKPTYGRLSRAGSFPFVDAFDHLGPLARSVEDLALSFDAMQGWDPDDPVCTDRPAEPDRSPSWRRHRRPAHRHRRRLFRQRGAEPAGARSGRAPSPRRWARPGPSCIPRGRRGARGRLRHHRDRGQPAPSAAAADAAAGLRPRHARALHGRRAAARRLVRQGAALPPALPRPGAEAVRARSTSSWRRPRPAPRPSSAR